MTKYRRSGGRLGYAPRVLVVNSEPSTQALIDQTLSDVGYHVTLVRNGRLALAQIRSREFGAVIVDLSLPDQSGIELIHQILSEFPRKPILALSESAVGDTFEKAMVAGAADTLAMPATPQTILLKVYGLIEPRGTWAGK